MGNDGALSQNGSGSGQAPVGAGDAEAVGDQVAADALHRAGGTERGGTGPGDVHPVATGPRC